MKARIAGMVVAGLLLPTPPPIAVEVRYAPGYGGIEPVRVTMTVTLPAHAENRAVCLGYEGDQAWRGCWQVDGEHAPRLTQVTSGDIYGDGDYIVYASLCRGVWDGNASCSAPWIQSAPRRFHVIGRMGNLSYKGRKR